MRPLEWGRIRCGPNVRRTGAEANACLLSPWYHRPTATGPRRDQLAAEMPPLAPRRLAGPLRGGAASRFDRSSSRSACIGVMKAIDARISTREGGAAFFQLMPLRHRARRDQRHFPRPHMGAATSPRTRQLQLKVGQGAA